MPDLPSTHRSRSSRLLSGAVLLPFLVIFVSSFGPHRDFAFRDIAHYYVPYWGYVHQQWADGGFPGWNSLEENGRPLAADATASVFYPGQLVFFLPLSLLVASKLFIYLHVLLAAANCFFAARAVGVSRDSSVFAAIAYAFGGSIVFQYCNPIFLVGAAWVPLGFAAIEWLVVSGQIRFAAGLSAVMALTVLGGNPQSAYLLVLVALLRIACTAKFGRISKPVKQELKSGDPSDGPGNLPGQKSMLGSRRIRLLGLLVGACVFALSLSAVQVWPSLEWASVSERADYHAPRSFSEIVVNRWTHGEFQLNGLYQQPEPGTHRAVQYNFSIGPWRWAELLWPNFSGRPFPRNERWLNGVPAEGRYWSPSLYMGLLPILLGISGWRIRSSDQTQRWLSWSVLFFCLGALGGFGLFWLWNELQLGLGMRPAKNWAPVGGLYWLMNALLPGFVVFRYPAKLWTFVALGFSLLAGKKLDDLLASSQSFLGSILFLFSAITFLLLVGVFLFAGPIQAWFASVPPDLAFGPLNQSSTLIALRWTFVHSLVIAGGTYLCLGKLRQLRLSAVPFVLITAIDLAIANAWMAPTVATLETSSTSPPIATILAAKPAGERPVTFRWAVSGWYPPEWKVESDSRRLEQLVLWDRTTLRPKYNLNYGIAAMNSSTSFASIQQRAILKLLQQASKHDSQDFYRLLNLLGIEYVIAPVGLDLSEPLERMTLKESTTVTQSAALWRNPEAGPRVWLVHRLRLAEGVGRSVDLKADLKEMFCNQLEQENIHHCVVLEPGVEFSSLLRQMASNDPGPTSGEFCEVLDDQNSKLVIRACLERPGLVVVRDSYAPGWSCFVKEEGSSSSRPASILRANRFMRAVPLPAGTYQLTMVYRPRAVYRGAIISAFAWLSLLLFASLCMVRKRS